MLTVINCLLLIFSSIFLISAVVGVWACISNSLRLQREKNDIKPKVESVEIIKECYTFRKFLFRSFKNQAISNLMMEKYGLVLSLLTTILNEKRKYETKFVFNVIFFVSIIVFEVIIMLLMMQKSVHIACAIILSSN